MFEDKVRRKEKVRESIDKIKLQIKENRKKYAKSEQEFGTDQELDGVEAPANKPSSSQEVIDVD
jgi:hypothetical protein